MDSKQFESILNSQFKIYGLDDKKIILFIETIMKNFHFIMYFIY